MSNLKELLDSHELCPNLVNLIMNVVSSRKQKVPVVLHSNIEFDGIYSVFKA